MHWNRVYNQKLTNYLEGLLRRIKKKVVKHIDGISASLGLPMEYVTAYNLYNYKIDAYVRRSEIEISQAIREFRQETRDIRYKSKSVINRPMEAAYIEANACSGKCSALVNLRITNWRNLGKGVKARQAEAMECHADKIGKELFATAAEEITKLLGEARKKLGAVVTAIFTRLVDSIYKEERIIAKSVCQKDKKVTKKNSTLACFRRLKIDIQSDIMQWTDRWEALKARLPEKKYDPATDQLDFDEEAPVAKAKPKKTKRKKVIKDEEGEDGMPLAKIPKKEASKGKKSKNPWNNAPGVQKKTGAKPGTQQAP